MSEPLPISCISCRTKKIKCNKKNPCNQCERRSIRCLFPAKFRNVKIAEEDLNRPTGYSDDQQDYASDYGYDHQVNHVAQGHHHPQYVPPVLQNIHQIHHIHESTGKSIHQLENELHLLRTDHTRLLQENMKLNIQLSKQIKTEPTESVPSKLPVELKEQKEPQESKEPTPGRHEGIQINGETTEAGEKYYGPQSSSFMIESLKQRENSDDGSAPGAKSVDEGSDTKGKPYNHRDFLIENSSSSSDSKFTIDFKRSIDEGSSLESHKSHNRVERSLSKKHLPILLYSHLKFNDPDLTSDSETYQDLYTLNFNITYKLVEMFFSSNRHYESFISRAKVFEFLDNYQFIKDKEWENDDDLLLFYMILLLSIQKLTPSEFVELNLLGANAIHQYTKFKNYLSKNILHHNFQKLRHNLLNESIITIQSYILCTEWYFIEQRYEECWSMMFHCCSIAYSIGLHVMGQFRLVNSTSKHMAIDGKAENKLLDDDEENDKEMDIARFKLWFALKNLTGQICSILGRPNPISIQVNSIVLRSSPDSIENLTIEKKKTETLLKIGLSECLRLSNSMLIENFMIDFTINDLLQLDAKFEKEIETLQLFASGETYEIESHGDYLKIDKVNVLMDLIILHINRAKLFEPFIIKFGDVEEYDSIIKNLVNSVLKFLELLNSFIEEFLNSFIGKHFHVHLPDEDSDSVSTTSSNSGKCKNYMENQRHTLNANLKVGKLFRILYPFLNSFIYQGIIVVFTFLHYKFDDFVKNKDSKSSLINNDFLRQLEISFNALLNFDRRVSGVLKAVTKLWASNISYLINKVLQHVKMIYEKQNKNYMESTKKRKRQEEADQEKARYHEQQQRRHQEQQMFEQQRQTNDYMQSVPSSTSQSSSKDAVNQNEEEDVNAGTLYGFNLNDPFWLTNPENLPYYLSSPSEEGPESTYKEQTFDASKSATSESGAREKSDMMQPEIFNMAELNTPQMNFGNSWGSPQGNSPQIQRGSSGGPSVPTHNPSAHHLLQVGQQPMTSNYGHPGQPPTVISNTFIFELPYAPGLNFTNSTNISSQLYNNAQQPQPTYFEPNMSQTPTVPQSPQLTRMPTDSDVNSSSSSGHQGQPSKSPPDKTRYNHMY